MTVTLEIPDQLASQLAQPGQDLSRAALEAQVVEAYRAERLSENELAVLLGLSRFELDGFLKERGVWLTGLAEDYQRGVELAKRMRERGASLVRPASLAAQS